MKRFIAFDPVIRGGGESSVSGYSKDREQYFEHKDEQTNRREELRLEQQKLQIQQQQHDTNSQLVNGGLVIAGTLVVSIAVYLLVKAFKSRP
jgi:hypothetical protein